MKYYRKSSEIEAFIFDGSEEYPDWFQKKVDESTCKIIKCNCKKCQEANDYEVLGFSLYSKVTEKEEVCGIGDYVLSRSGEFCGVLNPQDFDAKFAVLREVQA